jgi:hypothetical protein
VGNNAKAVKIKSDERRGAPREKLDPIPIRALTSIDHRTMLSRTGAIVDASKTGFLLHINRKDLLPKEFRESLSISELEGDRVILNIEPMNLEIGGVIARTKRLNKDVYEICVDFSDDAPEYWREALLDMLPRRTDFENN